MLNRTNNWFEVDELYKKPTIFIIIPRFRSFYSNAIFLFYPKTFQTFTTLRSALTEVETVDSFDGVN